MKWISNETQVRIVKIQWRHKTERGMDQQRRIFFSINNITTDEEMIKYASMQLEDRAYN